MTIQKFTSKGNAKEYFTFGAHEVTALLKFMSNIKRIHFPDDGRLNISDRDLEELLLQPDQLRRIAADNQHLLAAIARNEITTEDVVALSYRKKQLGIFSDCFPTIAISTSASSSMGRDRKGCGSVSWKKTVDSRLFPQPYKFRPPR
ncbi:MULTISPECIES: hypothetical protein [Sinorhizobium]|uniref:hypothetical protein n=1 Tax=Sinorhizobium TaxID=28105 RepID=UPI001F455D86|nr:MULTISPECIES: hypothetical protein [Sinorhizobium]